MTSPIFSEPRSAYVHVPFCRHRCGYCDFTLVAGRDDLAESYLRALGIELSQLERPREVDTLFFGGGTPTHLEPELLRQLLKLVNQWFQLVPSGEFSVEANPFGLIDEKIELYLESGVRMIWIVNPRRKTVSVYRPDAEPEANAQIAKAPHHMVSLPMMDVSSTEVRRRVAAGESIAGLVPEAVARYIERRRLYR